MVAETGLEPASTDYESVPGGFTTPVYSASTFQTGYGGRIRTYVNEFQRLAPCQLGHSVRIVIWWTWHDLNVRPRPSHGRALIPLSYRSSDSSGGERACADSHQCCRSISPPKLWRRRQEFQPVRQRTLVRAPVFRHFSRAESAHALRGDLVPINRDCHTIRRRLRKNCPPATAGGSDFGGRDRT